MAAMAKPSVNRDTQMLVLEKHRGWKSPLGRQDLLEEDCCPLLTPMEKTRVNGRMPFISSVPLPPKAWWGRDRLCRCCGRSLQAASLLPSRSAGRAARRNHKSRAHRGVRFYNKVGNSRSPRRRTEANVAQSREEMRKKRKKRFDCQNML